MNCSQCGENVNDNALFCPNCGHKLQQSPPPPSQSEQQASIQWGGDARPQKKGCGVSMAVIIIAAVVVLIVGAIGAYAIYRGMQDRGQNEARLAEEHFVQGKNYLEEEQHQLAIAEFEMALELNPDHRQAANKLAEAEQALQTEPTATSALQEETAVAYWNQLYQVYQAQDWDAVLDYAEKLLAADPEYNRDSVDQMLFEAFYHLGQQRVEEDRMEEALRYFDKALNVKEDSAVAEAQQLASLYMSGKGYWAADWEKTIEYLAQVYAIDPQYKDVEQRLAEAYANQARLLGEEGEWCRAAEAYGESQAILDLPKVASEYDAARQNCTQTPDASPEPTVTNTPEGEEPSGPSGQFVGSLVKEEYIESEKIFFRGQVFDKNGDPVPQIVVQVQAWDWSATAVTDGNGQYSFDGLSYPTTYRLSLPGQDSEPFDVEGEGGKLKWVDFHESP